MMTVPSYRLIFLGIAALVYGSFFTQANHAHRSIRHSEGKNELSRRQIEDVTQAIKDEIYDYSQERAFFKRAASSSSVQRRKEVPVYINPQLSAQGMGEAIYMNPPFGEIIRVFHLNQNGLIVLTGGPQIGFPVTQPSHLTEFMDKGELSDDKAHWRSVSMLIEANPTKRTIHQSSTRQLQRVGFSHYLGRYLGGRSQ